MVYYPANKRYKDKSVLRVSIDFNRNTEPDMVKKMEEVSSRAGYIKELIRADLAKVSPEDENGAPETA